MQTNVTLPEKENTVKRKRIFQEKITWGVIEKLDMGMSEIELNLRNIRDAKPAFIRTLINALLIEGEPITAKTSPAEFKEAFEDLQYFLEIGRRKQERREGFKQKRSPNV